MRLAPNLRGESLYDTRPTVDPKAPDIRLVPSYDTYGVAFMK